MKAMYLVLNLLALLLVTVESKPFMVEMVDCSAEGGTVPREIFNSRYQILPDGKLCCPLDIQLENGELYCIPRDRVSEQCEKDGRGVVFEPCVHCMTCAKLLGEQCEGPHYTHGICDSGLKCAGTEQNENGTGVCIPVRGVQSSGIGEVCGGPLDSFGVCTGGLRCTGSEEESGVCVMEAKTQGFNWPCGGVYGSLGRCVDTLRCSVAEELFLSENPQNISGRCFREDQPAACFRQCPSPSEKLNYVCGTDGVWYHNKCAMKQQNCPLLSGATQIGKAADTSICGPEPTAAPTTAPTPAPTTPTVVPDPSSIITTEQAKNDTLVAGA